MIRFDVQWSNASGGAIALPRAMTIASLFGIIF
jgi:hypothetical protein